MLQQFLKSAFDALPDAARSPLSFAAFVILIISAFLIAFRVRRFRRLLDSLEALPERDRLAAIREEIGAIPLGEKLNAEQYVRARLHQYYLYAFFATLAVIFLLMMTFLWNHSGSGEEGTIDESAIQVEVLPYFTYPPLFAPPMDSTQVTDLVRWDRPLMLRNVSSRGLVITDIALKGSGTRGSIRSTDVPRLQEFRPGETDSLSRDIHLPLPLEPHASIQISAQFALTVRQGNRVRSFRLTDLDDGNALIPIVLNAAARRPQGPAYFGYEIVVTFQADGPRKLQRSINLVDSAYFTGMVKPDGSVASYHYIPQGGSIGRSDPQFVQTAFTLGVYSEGTSWVGRPEQEILRHVTLHSDDLDATLVLASTYVETGKYDQARTLLERFRSRNDDERSVISNDLGVVEFEQRHYRRGLVYFEQALKYSECLAGVRDALHNVREYYLFRKQIDSASVVLTRQIAMCPELARPAVDQLWSLMVDGADPKIAREGFLRFFRQHPEDGDASYRVGAAYMLAEENQTAIQYYRDAQELGTTKYTKELGNNMAICLIKLGRLQEAEPYARANISRNPRDYHAHYHLAYIAWKQHHDLETAVHEYKTVIQIEPNFKNAYVELSDVYAEMGQNSAAELYRRRAEEISPSDVTQ